MEFCHGIVRIVRGVYELQVSLHKLFHLALCIGVCLCHANTCDAAFHGGVDDGIAFAAILKCLFHRLAVMPGNDDKKRHAGEYDQGKDPIDGQQIHEGKHQHHAADKQVFRAMVRKLTNLEKVACNARHDLACFVVIVKSERQLFQVGE